MRLVLMGTGPFAVPSFDRIVASGHDVRCVIARPMVQNTAKAPPESPVVQWARGLALPIETPDSINESRTVEWLRTMELDLMVVCDYGQILSREALAASRLGGINLHGSLLPRHRGAAPVQWSILSGDQHAGVSVIHMTPALDAGPILMQAQTNIGPTEHAGELESRLSRLGVEPTLASIQLLADRPDPVGIVQDQGLATKAPRLKKTDGELNLAYPVHWIDRQIRGLQPWPGVYANLVLPDNKSMRILLHRARPFENLSVRLTNGPLANGTLLYGSALELLQRSIPELPSKGLVAVAGDGFLALDSIQPAGKKPMSAEEFLRGYARHVGMRLEIPNSPQSLLEKMISLVPQSGKQQ